MTTRQLLPLLMLASLSCGPATSGAGETTPTLPGDDPVAAGDPKPDKTKKPPKKKEPDPWEGRTDLIKSPPTGKPAKVDLPKVERFELPNGLKVLVIENHTLPAVSFHLAVRAGGSQEARDKRGTADYAAAMLTKGTKKRSADQIADSIDFVGGVLGAGSDYEATHVTCGVLAQHIGTCLDLLPDVVMAPAFPAKEMDEVRKQLVGAVKQRREDPEALAEDHFENALWGDDHVRGWPVTLDTIGAIQQKDLADWHGAYFKPGNSVLAIAGDVDAKAVKAQVTKAFAPWKKGAAPEEKAYAVNIQKGVRVRLVDKPDQSQSQILVGQLGIAHGDDDYFATVLMNYALGGGGFSSRLMKVVRSEGGKTYGASSGFDRYRTRGAFIARTFTRNQETVATLLLVLGEIAKMAKEGPTEAELADAKSNIAGGYPLGFQSADDVAGAVLSAELHGLGEDYVREFPLRIAGVSLGDARSAAKEHLDTKNAVIVIVGKAEDVAPQLDAAGIKYEKVGWLEPVSKIDRDAARKKKEAPPDPKMEAEGRKLLDQAIVARGGEKKLRGIKEIVAKGTMTIDAGNGRTVEGEYTKYWKSPDKLRIDLALPGKGTVRFVLLAGSAWVQFEKQLEDVPADTQGTLKVLLFADLERILLHHKDKGVVVQSQGKQTIDGTDYDTVRVVGADKAQEAVVLLDPKSHLPVGVCYLIETETLCDQFGDYKAVNGIQMPHSLKTVNLLLGGVPLEVTFDKIEVNAGLPAAAFDHP